VSIDPIKRVRSYVANVCFFSLFQTFDDIVMQMYYQPNASRDSRPNLTVLFSAHVNKLILKHESGVVTADRVQFVHGGKDHEISIAKEVILRAG
jgi:hypothetical protein